MLGVEDAYDYKENEWISPENDMMRWYNVVNPQVTANDVRLAFNAFINNKFQYWSSYGLKRK